MQEAENLQLLLDLAIKRFHLTLKTNFLLICSSPTTACFVDWCYHHVWVEWRGWAASLDHGASGPVQCWEAPQSYQMLCPPPSCDSDGPLIGGLILIIVDRFFQSPEDRPFPDAFGQTLKMCSTSTTPVLVARAFWTTRHNWYLHGMRGWRRAISGNLWKVVVILVEPVLNPQEEEQIPNREAT